jgi:hypothetical protein
MAFVRWFEETTIGDEWRDFLDRVPISRVYEVADEARRRAARWLDFASRLEGKATRQPEVPLSLLVR